MYHRMLRIALFLVMVGLVTHMVFGSTTSAQQTCTSECELDVVMVLDVSGSMSGAPLNYLKEGAHVLINDTCPDGAWAMGIVAFNDTARNLTLGLVVVDSDLVKKDLNDTIDSLSAGGGTALGYGIGNATAMFIDSGRPGVRRIMIIFTDGEPTIPGTSAEAKDYARQKADEARTHGIIIVGIFAGDPGGTGDEFLQSISDYFINVSIDQLPQAFKDLTGQVCFLRPKSLVGAELELAQPVVASDTNTARIVGIIAAISAGALVILRRGLKK